MAQVLLIGVATGAIYGIFALGLVLVYKTSRVLNFAQAEVGTFATFLAWMMIVQWELPWLLGVLLAVSAAAALGATFERTVARPLVTAPRLTLVVATVAVASLLVGVELKLWDTNPHLLPTPIDARGITLAGVVLTPPRLVALAVTVGLVVTLAWFFKRTTFGLALLALAQDPDGVRLTGIRVRHLTMFTWATSFAIGALGGILTAWAFGAFAMFFMARVMLLGFAAAVLGGMTSLSGALLGGLGLGLLDAGVQKYFLTTPGLVEALTFGLIVLVLLVRPQGLLGRVA